MWALSLLIRFINSRHLCAAAIAVSVCYTVWYLHFGNPAEAQGALSTIGLKHPVLFALWGAVTEAALFLNIRRMYVSCKYKNRWASAMLVLAALSILTTVLVPYEYRNLFFYITHCAGAISFVIYNGAALLILFVKYNRKSAVFRVTMYLTITVLLSTLVLFAALGESGLLETIPLFLAYVIVSLVNFTPLYRIRSVDPEFFMQEKKKNLVHK